VDDHFHMVLSYGLQQAYTAAAAGRLVVAGWPVALLL